MRPGTRLVLLCVLAPLTLSACGFTATGTESGGVAPPTTSSSGTTVTPPQTPPKVAGGGGAVSGDHNAALASASVGGALEVAVGASRAVVVTFTSNDGLPLSGFAVSGSLGTLPPGWSGPSTLTCGAVGPGSGCALSLTYAPLALDSGTLTLNCVYIDNAGLPRTPGPCLTLTYAAALPNNVAATISPAGEVDAIAGSSKQSVSVNFTTDDGSAATNLSLATNLAALPAGWSSSATSLSCPVVSTGSGCQLPLTFAPSASAAGLLVLNYTYVDNAGATRNGAINIPYAATSSGTVRATASPTGQINAVAATGSQAVSITFTTDDGNAATGLSVAAAELAALPSGWSSASAKFSCDSVTTGNGCQLQLQFAPTSLGGGVLTLSYGYIDSSGAPNSGLAEIVYAATTNDSVAGAVSPSGEVNAMLGSSQPISVTFTTDDSRLATALQVAGSLTSLPAGWSSTANAFACSTLSVGSTCQLALMFSPAAVDNGTLMLEYSYVNNAGEAKSGSLGIPYRTTTNDNVVGSSNPSSLAVAAGSSNPAVVTFNTDDGNVAENLSVDLTTLPADWSAPASTLTCATVSVGTGCQVSLSYAPTIAESATLSFGFSYTDSAGTMKTGTVSIPYSASP